MDSTTVALTNSTLSPTALKGAQVWVQVSHTFSWVTPISPLLTFIGGSSLSAPTITYKAYMRLE